METDATTTLREYLEGAFTRKDPTVIDATVAPDVVDHAGVPGQPEGIEGFRVFVGMVTAAFPDLVLTVEDCFGDGGEKAVARWTATATHGGDFLGIAPTGRPVAMSGMDIARVGDGKIVELWAQVDLAAVMMQISEPA
jgi:steroid delta-isomerase-like uncharacterized protein